MKKILKNNINIKISNSTNNNLENEEYIKIIEEKEQEKKI